MESRAETSPADLGDPIALHTPTGRVPVASLEGVSRIVGRRRMLPAFARAARDAAGADYAAICALGRSHDIEIFVPSGPAEGAPADAGIEALGDIMVAAGLRAGERTDAVISAPIVGEDGLDGWVYAASRSGFAADAVQRLADVALATGRAFVAPRTDRGSIVSEGILHSLSHEVRTPLTVILASVRTLQVHRSKLDDATQDELLRRIDAGAQRLQEIVTELFELRRIERGQSELRVRPTDIGGLVRMVVSESDLSGARPMHVDTPRVVADVDAVKIERIVEHLLSNVQQHTPAGSPVNVHVSAEGDDVCIVVEDRGPGVPPEERETIFEPMRIGSTASAHSPGTGLGLAIVAGYAELHGGYARMDPRPDGGSSFRVCFPKRRRRAEGP